jgi:hypothetical protein
MADESTNAAVYVGWTTFMNAINSLAEGMPSVVDRSVFPGLSGGVQSQLLAGLRFLGLISEDGTPTDDLSALAVTDEDARKSALNDILRTRYAALFALDLTKTTSAMLYDKMAEAYKVSGDTREKAVRWFLAAAQYAGVPLGRFLLTSKAASGGVPRKQRRNGSRSAAAVDEVEDQGEEAPPPARPGTGKTVQLKSGGTLTVSATVDMFGVSAEDRTFLFDLIDKLNAYERANEPTR